MVAASPVAAPPAPAPSPTVSCAIRFRLDGSGPAAFLVECDGELRVYARGALGGVLPRGRLMALLAERGCRWVPASGSLQIHLEDERADQPPDRPLPVAPFTGLLAAAATHAGSDATAPC